jgi:hypothetical protein
MKLASRSGPKIGKLSFCP